MCIRFPDRCIIENIEKAVEAVGLSQHNVTEFTADNISDFNTIAHDAKNVDYYSIGA
jgi:hypothetical protein